MGITLDRESWNGLKACESILKRRKTDGNKRNGALKHNARAHSFVHSRKYGNSSCLSGNSVQEPKCDVFLSFFFYKFRRFEF